MTAFFAGFEGVDQPRQPAANLYPDTRPGYDVPTPVDPGSGTTPSSVPLGFDGTGRTCSHQAFNLINTEIPDNNH